MTTFQKDVLSLIKASLIPNNDVKLCFDFDWNALLALGQAHQIIPLLYYGVKQSGVDIPDAVSARLKSETLSCIVADEKQRHTVEEILRVFGENKIDHLPLKGVEIKSLYPASEMRMMGDADILIREEQYKDIRPLLLAMGFEEGVKSPHEYIWIKKGFLFLELHHRTFAPRNKEFVKFYGDGWRNAILCNDMPYRYQMTAEATIVYLVTHLAKHYRDCGIGIRHMLDIRIFLQAHPTLDHASVRADLAQLHLDVFYENLLKTLAVWFDGAAACEVTDLITRRVFDSGSYGKQESKAVVNVTEEIQSQKQMKHARRVYLFRRIFPAFKNMCIKYKWLRYCPILLPVMWIVRLCEIVLFKQKQIARVKTEWTQMTEGVLVAEQKERHAVGLHFAFEDED